MRREVDTDVARFQHHQHWADDVAAATKWYAELLGTQAYFERSDDQGPAYVEFRVGDSQDELGLIARRYAPAGSPDQPGGVVSYWHVDDVQAAFDRMLAMGAKEYQPVIEREAGWITASVVDPFGNIVGVMYSPHYLEVLGSA